MDKKTQTIHTYNQSANLFADKFDGIGARIDDVDEVFALQDKDNPKVLEIGCGNGRDAEIICNRTSDYLGIDVSDKLIQLAREKLPNARFEVADVEFYVFPNQIDIVFAFASLIHTPREVLREVFRRTFGALSVGGLFRLSMKYSDISREITKDDEFGTRTYYHYSQEDIKDLAASFMILKNEIQEVNGQIWLEVLLQKSK